jgi:RNA polymerase sigma-70 factor (ECF subfamily)
MNGQTSAADFERRALPHLDDAYTLARWLMGNVSDAEDAVREAYVRAFRSDCREEDNRAWLLQIVRNTCYTRMHAESSQAASLPFEEDIHSKEVEGQTPETMAIDCANIHVVRQAIQELPLNYREVLILREGEEMSYGDIAKVTCMPVAAAGPTLFQARRLLRERLHNLTSGEKMSASKLPLAE